MEKEFVTYEIGLELKALGFDEPCISHYTVYGKFSNDYSAPRKYNSEFELGSYISAPLFQQAFRWFREKHDWIGGVRLLSHESISGLLGEFTEDKDNGFMMFGSTYEEIELRCLKELIEIVKNK